MTFDYFDCHEIFNGQSYSLTTVIKYNNIYNWLLWRHMHNSTTVVKLYYNERWNDYFNDCVCFDNTCRFWWLSLNYSTIVIWPFLRQYTLTVVKLSKWQLLHMYISTTVVKLYYMNEDYFDDMYFYNACIF